jgi:hypothetical protein
LQAAMDGSSHPPLVGVLLLLLLYLLGISCYSAVAVHSTDLRVEIDDVISTSLLVTLVMVGCLFFYDIFFRIGMEINQLRRPPPPPKFTYSCWRTRFSNRWWVLNETQLEKTKPSFYLIRRLFGYSRIAAINAKLNEPISRRSMHNLCKMEGLKHVWLRPVHELNMWHIKPKYASRRGYKRYKTDEWLPEGRYGAVESFFDDSPQKNAVLSPNVENYLRNLRIQKEHVPWAVPTAKLPLLDRLGLPHPAAFSPVHEGNHPIAATLELASLRFVRTLLTSLTWYGLFINSDKLVGFTAPTGLYNPKLVSKDVTRFRKNASFVAAPPRSAAPTWFIHDTIQNLSASEVGSWFDTNRSLGTLVATICVPAETKLRLPSLFQGLYSLRYYKSMVKITFEGDSGGAYWQPADSWKWTHSETLITPRGECLHMGVVYSKGPHNIVVIRREQMLPGMLVAPTFPELMVVPKWVLPFSGLADRLTIPRLVEKLEDFSASLDTTDWRGFMTKIRQYQMTESEMYPASFKVAASCYVLASRAFRGTWQASPLTSFSLFSTLLFSMPLLAPAWLFSSFLYSLQCQLVPVEEPIDPEPTSMVSQHSDWTLPTRDVCNFPSVKTHYVPPNATPFERFWVKVVSVQALLVIKFIVSVLVDHGAEVYRLLRNIVPVVVFRLSITVKTPFLMIPGILLTYWWDITLEDALQHLRDLWEFVYDRGAKYVILVWKMYWGLPSLPLPRMRAGYSPLWRTLSFWAWISFLFPDLLHPIPSVHCVSDWRFGIPVAILVAVASFPKPFKRRLYPYHSVRTLVRTDIETITDSHTENSSTTSDSASTMSSLFDWRCESISEAASSIYGTASEPSTPVLTVQPLPTFQPRQNPIPPMVAAAAPAPLPAPAPLAPINPPAPAANLNPFNYHIDPSAFPTAALFSFGVRLLPLPQAFPPPANMCVWDCLGTLLACDPAVLWAIFNASYPGIAPNGSVPFHNLNTVFSYFRVSGNITRCRDDFTIGTDWPVEAYGTVVPDWPVFDWSMVDRGQGVYHLVAVSPRLSNNGGGQPVPLPFNLVAATSRFVSISEMRYALNIPTRAFLRVYQAYNGFMNNPALGSALANTDTPGQPPIPGPGLPPPVAIPPVDLRPEDLVYRLTAQDIADAQNLARDYKKYPQYLEVVDSSAYGIASAIDALADHAKPSDFNFRLYHGTYGTGKTTALIREVDALLTNGVGSQDILIVCPNDALKSDIMADMKRADPRLVSNNFCTQGRVFSSGARYIFFDDATLFYPGFIQLVLCSFPHLARAYFTFDALQNKKVFPQPNCSSRKNIATSAWLSRISNTYATRVYRTSRSITELFGLDSSLCRTEGEIYIVSEQPRDVPLFVASPRFAETKNNGGQETYAFSDVQGRTFDGDTCIDLGGLSGTATDAAAMTAMTRGRGSIWLQYKKNAAANDMLQEVGYGSSLIFSAILAVSAQRSSSVINSRVDVDRLVARAFQSHMAHCLSPAACAALGLNPPQPVVAGVERSHERFHFAQVASRERPELTARSFMPTANNTPFSNQIYTGVEGRDMPRAAFRRHAVRNYIPFAQDSDFKVHADKYVPPPLRIPRPLYDPIDAFDTAPVNPEEEAVVHNYIEPTNVRDPYGPTEAQHHMGKDDALLWKSQPERFPARHDSPDLTPKDKLRLAQLLGGFRKSVALPDSIPLNEALLEDCLVHCLDSWFSGKSKVQITKAVNDWEVDDDPLFIRVFQKGQWIKKLEARGAPVKKSQTIARVAMSRTFRDAMWCEYMERAMRPHFRSNFLFFNRMNPTQLKEWYRSHWKPGIGITANDYTGWDTGMDRVFLAFDLWIMETLSFPQRYQDEYKNARVNSRTFIGPYPIMQPSGDRYTLFLNSMRNAAITGASLDMPVNTPLAICGDDSAVCGIFPATKHFRPQDWRIKPKTYRGRTASFCGWTFGKANLYCDLKSLTYRARIGLQRGESSPDFWRSAVDMLPLTNGDPSDYSELQIIFNSVSEKLCRSFVSPFDHTLTYESNLDPDIL